LHIFPLISYSNENYTIPVLPAIYISSLFAQYSLDGSVIQTWEHAYSAGWTNINKFKLYDNGSPGGYFFDTISENTSCGGPPTPTPSATSSDTLIKAPGIYPKIFSQAIILFLLTVYAIYRV